MKKQALLFFALLSVCAFGQGVRYDVPPILNSRAVLVPNANISLCPGTATITNSTCSPASTQAFTDITLTTPCATGSPVVLPQTNVCSGVADALGNAGFWLAPGAYIYCINGPSITGKCYNLTVPSGATSGGGLTTGNLNNILYVNGSPYTKNTAGIQAALAQCSTNGGGIVYLTDVSLGNFPTLTGTLTVPPNCVMMVGAMQPNGGLISSACPAVRLNGGGAGLVGYSPTAFNSGQNGSVITAIGNSPCASVDIVSNCTDCFIEKMNLKGGGGSGDGRITIQDNQRELLIRKTLIGPIQECVQYVNAGSNQGFDFIEFDQVRCDGYTGSGYDFKLTSGTGTNLRFLNTFANCAPSTGCIGYDVARVNASFDDCGADNGSIGYRANNAGVASTVVRWAGSESQANTTNAVQITGAGMYVVESLISSQDQAGILVNSASADTFIQGVSTTQTVGANTIVYASGASGQHVLLKGNKLDKPISVAAGVNVEEHDPQYTVISSSTTERFGIGTSNGSSPTFTFEGNDGGTGGVNCLGLDRSNSNKTRFCNEGNASSVINGSAQDDTSIRVIGGANALNTSTDAGGNLGFRIFPANKGWDLLETTAPASTAARDACYGDSTLHALKCSYNNGTFFQIPQVITATSAAFATATTAGTCVNNTTAVTGATTAMVVSISPVSTPGVGAVWSAFVSSAGNVTINECAVATSAGGTIAFNIRVFP